MKRFIIFVFLPLLIVFSLYSCNDSRDVFYSSDTEVSRGGFAKFEVAPPAKIDGSQPSTAKFSAIILDPAGNLDYYQVAKVTATIGGKSYTTTSYNPKITSFPNTLEIKINDLAAVLGIPVNNFGPGDMIAVEAKVVTKGGITYPLSTTVGTTSYTNFPNENLTYANQAMKFSFLLACPSVNIDNMVGDFYVRDVWWPYNLDYVVTVEKVSSTQLRIKKFNEGGKDVLINVNTTTGEVTMPKQLTGESYSAGPVSVETRTPGLIFTCSGYLTMPVTYTVSAGTYGTFKYELIKK